MSRIRIKGFGPIRNGCIDNDGWIEVKKNTVFVGNQASGKSTLAKLITTFLWMEKALNRGDYKADYFTGHNRFRKTYCAYHRIENYFLDLEGNDHAEIEYEGTTHHFKYTQGKLTIKETGNTNYELPQIMYVPAERNFIANVKTPRALKLTSDSLVDFVTEFDNAKNAMSGAMEIPLSNNLYVEYQSLNDVVYVKGKNHKIQLKEASSGIQSIVPLYLVSWFLSKSVGMQAGSSQDMSSEEIERFKEGVEEIWKNTNFTDEQRKAALSVLSSRFRKTAFVNIVEEPEQNLFPSSQREMIHNLLKYNNQNPANNLIITTHSPYLINYLTLAVKAGILKDKLNPEQTNKLNSIVPLESTISPDNITIYELDDEDGVVRKLDDYNGIPSDRNYLNKELNLSNILYDSLLEIEEEL